MTAGTPGPTSPSLAESQCAARSLMDVELLRRRLASDDGQAPSLLAREYHEVWSRLAAADDPLAPKLAAWRKGYARFRFLLARDDRWLDRGLRFAQYALSAPVEGPVAGEARAWLRRSRPNAGLLVRRRDGGHEALLGALDTKKPVAALAPHPDGRRLFCGGLDGGIEVWDSETGERLANLGHHAAAVHALCVCPPFLASCAADGTLMLWSLDGHAKVATVTAHKSAANAIAAMGDLARIATAGEEGCVRIWKLPSLEQAFAFGAKEAPLRAVLAYHGDTIVAAGGSHLEPLWWVRRPGGQTIRLLGGPTTALTGLALDGEDRVVASCEDGSLYVWKGDETEPVSLPMRQRIPLLATAALPGTASALAACRNGVLYAAPLQREQEICELGRHDGPVTACAGWPANRAALSGGQDGIVAWWSTKVFKPSHAHAGRVRALIAAGTTLYSGGADGAVRRWDTQLGTSVPDVFPSSSPVTALAVGPGLAFAGLENGELRACTFDAARTRRFTQLAGHGAEICGLGYVPETGLLISAGWDGLLRVWKAGKEPGAKLTPDGELPHGGRCLLALAVDGQRGLVASGGWEREILIHSLSSRKLLGQLRGHASPIVALATCGATLVSGDDNGQIGFSELGRGREVATYPGHGKVVTALVAAGDYAVSGGEDGYVGIWRTSERKRLHKIEASRGAISGLAPSPDGRQCAVAASDGILRVLSLESGEVTASFMLGSAATACGWVDGAIACGTRGGEVLLFELLASRHIVAASWHPERPLVATVDDAGTLSLGEWHGGAGYLEPLLERTLDDFAAPPTSESPPELAWSTCGQALRLVGHGKVIVLGALGLESAPDPGNGWLPPAGLSCDRRWQCRPGDTGVHPSGTPIPR